VRQTSTSLSSVPAFRLSILAASLWLSFGAAAQTDSTAAPEAGKKADAAVLKEVLVTAERRKSNVQKTAISMTAVSGEEIQNKGQSNLENVLSDTPAVQVQGSPQGGQIFIRGVGANGDSNWVDPAVSLNLDGVYSGRAERVFASMYDIARVEVLRGPQGTLYGRNATGGSVNVLSNNPSDHFEAGVNTQLGSYNLRHVDGYLNVPVNDVLAVRGALMREKRDGYFSNGGRASDLTSGRFKALLKPSSAFSLLATVDSFESKGLGATSSPRAYTASVPPWVNWRTDYSDPWEVDSLHPADTQKTRFTTYSVQADWDLGFGVLTLLPSLTKSNRYTESNLNTGIAAPTDTWPLPASTWKETQKTVELRLASPADSRIKWVVGAYGYSADNSQSGVTATSLTSTFDAYGTNVPSTSKALFGQLTYPVSDTFRVTGGLRYTKDEKTYNYGLRSTSLSSVSGYDSGMQSVSSAYNAVTYKTGVEVDLSRSSMLYAQISSGYKAGGFSTTSTPPLAYAPEKLTALELGSKNRFLGNRLQVNGELYYYNYKNYQVQYATFGAPSPIPGDTSSNEFQQYVVNAGNGKNLGFELESRYRVAPETELRGAVTYAHARYGDFSTPALSYLNGTRVASTPAWTATLGLEQSWGVGDGMLTAGIEVKFSDGYRVGLESGLPGGDLNVYQKAYHKTSLRLTYAPADQRWNVGLWLKNLENQAQTTQVLPWGRTQITDPRTFGLNVGYKF